MITRKSLMLWPTPPKPEVPTMFYDIETLPTEDPDVIQRVAEKINPPGNMYRPETVSRWVRDEKPQLVKEAVLKTGLDGTYGRVCCVGFAFDDAPAQAIIGEEVEVLTEFFQIVRDRTEYLIDLRDIDGAPYTEPAHRSIRTVGHNQKAFDQRFLWQRAVINKVQWPAGMMKPMGYSNHDLVQDTMLMWNPDPSKRISLDSLCQVLGVASPKAGFDGSMVYEAWKAGERGRIKRYCLNDVEAMRACWWALRQNNS